MILSAWWCRKEKFLTGGLRMGRFVKFTRLDGGNTPVWVNASFVVTVEPRKGGGALIVPMGDGMDYEVKESPETVLEMLEGTQVSEVIAVPAPTGLTSMSAVVSAKSDERTEETSESPAVLEETQSEKKVTAKKAVAKKKSAEKKPATPKKRASAKTKEVPIDPFVVEAVAFIRDCRPSSKKKIENTLKNKYRNKDDGAIESVLAELEKSGSLRFQPDGHAVYGENT
jgi:hypothetical protein